MDNCIFVIAILTLFLLSTHRFIKKPGETSYCKDWLRITPASSYIGINELIEIKLELNFDQPSMASLLNFGFQKMTDTLVLSLRGGKDIFITVYGDYRPSCFGCSLECLIALQTKPIGSMTVEQLAKEHGESTKLALNPAKAKAIEIQCKKESNLDLLLNLSQEINSQQLEQLTQDSLFGSTIPRSPSPLSGCHLPKELCILVDYLFKYGTFSNELFQSSGSELDFIRIRDALDRANPNVMKDVSVDSVAEAILLFLQSLPEPVIPYKFYDRVVANRDNFSNCRQVCVCYFIKL